MGSGSGAIVCVMSAVEEGENCAGGDAAAPSLTQGELKIICDDFDECDADKDGRLSMPEIKQLLHKQLERIPTEKESEDWLRQFDSNLDGDVTLQEYLSTMMPGGYCPPPPPEGWEPHVQAKFGYLHFSDTLLGQGAAGSVWSGKYWDGLRSISSDELGRLFLIAIDAHNPNCCDFAELFIDAGMDLNVKDANGSTVLHRMAVDGDIDSVELLLQRGADVDSLDGDGRTPMLAAAATHTNNVLRIVKMLIKKGAKKDACDKQNKNAYELAKSPKVRKFFRPW